MNFQHCVVYWVLKNQLRGKIYEKIMWMELEFFLVCMFLHNMQIILAWLTSDIQLKSRNPDLAWPPPRYYCLCLILLQLWNEPKLQWSLILGTPDWGTLTKCVGPRTPLPKVQYRLCFLHQTCLPKKYIFKHLNFGSKIGLFKYEFLARKIPIFLIWKLRQFALIATL